MILETFFSEEHGEQLERIACPNCRQDDPELYRLAHDRLFGAKGKYRVVRCRRCSMIYTNPRPTFESLGRHYPSDYVCYKPAETLHGLKRLIADGATRALVKQRIRMLEKVTGKLASGKQVLDVGCSFGQLLAGLKDQRGCEVVGVDFNESCVEYGKRRGVPIIAGTLKSAQFDDERFDVVTMTEYLEHEGNPADVLSECRRVSKPGAYIAIEVPLISTATSRMFGNYWSQLDLPRHLMFFSPETLTDMLEKCGYDMLHVRSFSGQPGISLLHVLGYENIGQMTWTDIIAATLANLAFLPMLPFMHEHMFAVARVAERSSVSSSARRSNPMLGANSLSAPSQL